VLKPPRVVLPTAVHTARVMPHRDDNDVPTVETIGSVQSPTIDADGALRGILAHLIHPTVLADDATDDPAVKRTVYDVTLVFCTTARLGPSHIIQYYVVPADASVTISCADNSTKSVGQIMLFLDLLLCVFIVAMRACNCNLFGCGDDDESSRDRAIPKNPGVALAQAAGASKARRDYVGGSEKSVGVPEH
jgi:hypothetical protein